MELVLERLNAADEKPQKHAFEADIFFIFVHFWFCFVLNISDLGACSQ